MFLTRKSLDAAPSFVRQEIKKLNARYTSDQVKAFDSDCATMVDDLRKRQKEYDRNIRQQLSRLNEALARVESKRDDLSTCVHEINGHEKIIENRMKELQTASEVGDAHKMAEAENKLRSATESYKRTMTKASGISGAIERDLAEIDALFAALKDAGGRIPARELGGLELFLQA